jgi:DUF2933 family protein
MLTRDQLTSSAPAWLLSPMALLSVAALLLAAGLYFTGHGEHLVAALFYLPLAACLLMHLFMHGKHRH